MARDRTGRSTTTSSSTPDASGIKCGHCGGALSAQGWCDNCRRRPLNVTPVRYCPTCDELIEASGYCARCRAWTDTEMLPTRQGWQDTRKIPTLVPREECRRRMGDLGRLITAAILRGQAPAATRDLEGEKRALREMDHKRQAAGEREEAVA